MPRRTPRGRIAALAAASALTITMIGGAATVAAPADTQVRDPQTDAASAQPGLDKSAALVRLSRAPLATSPRTRPAAGKKINLRSTAVRNERARIAAQRNAFKKWLRQNAPKARVTSQYDVALNAVAVRLNGTSLAKLRSAPGVVSVSYQARFVPTAHEATADPDLSLINAQTAWHEVGGGAGAGDGIKVGIVDSGIDVTHPCFQDSDPSDDGTYTNDKVIVAKVFANKRGYTPEAVDSHGTHVAGTVACNFETPATVDGVDIPYDPSGVAPAALLGNYNVFPGDLASARSEDILNALQAAYADGMDVINMSLGGPASGNQDLLTMAVDNLDRAGVVVATSAGNEGPGYYTVGSPGSAERALAAGASSVGHFVGLPVTVGEEQILTAVGDFPTPDAPLTGTLVAAPGDPLGLGCAGTDWSAAPDTEDWIAVVSRGDCTFSEKVQTAETAGAVAVIVVNNVAGDPTAMAGEAGIPAVMASLADRDTLAGAAGEQATIGSEAAYAPTGNDNIMAGFSSRGPTDVDFRVKPDVVAPGVNVLSSIPLSYCEGEDTCWAFFQGTSMASPHLAGMAAVVLDAHRDWSPAQVRSAIVNTAAEGVLTSYQDGTTPVFDPQIVGSGLADLAAAVDAPLAVSSVSTSFGAVPVRSRQPQQRTVTLTNLTDGDLTVPVEVDGAHGVGADAFSVSTGSVDVPAGGTASVTVSFDPREAEGPGGNYATLRFGDYAHAAVYAFVK